VISDAVFLVRDAYAKMSYRVPALVAVMVLSSLTEGLALGMALPLLTTVGNMGSGSAPAGASWLGSIPARFGLSPGPALFGGLMIGLLALSCATVLVQARLSARLQARYAEWWQVSLFQSALRADLPYLQERRSGELVHAIMTNASNVGGAFNQVMVALASLISLVVFMSLSFTLSPTISGFVIVVGVSLFLATRPLIRRAFRLGSTNFRESAELQAMTESYVGAAKLVKTSAAEEFVFERFGLSVHRVARLRAESAYDFQMAKAIFEIGGATCVSMLLILGPLVFHVGVSTVLVVLALFVRLLPRVTALQQCVHSLNSLLPSLHRVRAMVETAQARVEVHREGPLPAGMGDCAVSIALRGATVERAGRTVLDSIDLMIPAGGIVAFVGSSGSGKSTLVDALLGLVPLASGQIAVDGHDLTALPLSAWRRCVGYVSQDTSLLSGSIAENVSFGNGADLVTIDRALAGAAADFSRAGLDAEVGDRGLSLSGGERKWRGLARARAAPRRLYILDEATSALDSETEERIVETVSSLAGAATVIIIAHRFSAIRNAGMIHVIEDGRIVESGTWSDLDRPGRRFHEFKTKQEATGAISP
jgi:ATP-binding cassette, subfamily C, bacterial